MDISQNDNTTNVGEPEIAVNPRNPNQLYIDGATFSTPNPFVPPSVPDTCQGWASDNGGLTWQSAPLPPGICDEDGVAVFGRDGTLYAGGDTATSTTIVPCGTPGAIQFGNVCILVQGQDPVLTSRDDGHTWSAPVYTMGSTNLTPNGAPFPFVPGSGNPLNTFDRPWLAMDQSTNTLYAASHNIADHEPFVTASTDEAKSFGPIYAADSGTFPSNSSIGGTGSGVIAAANGVLAVAYDAVPAPGGCTTTCVIFETSTDHGATFTRHVVPLVGAASLPPVHVAADPIRRGQFALTVPDATGTENQVYTTDDFGQTWQGPTNVGEAPPNQRFKPWLSYGPSGNLLLVWRTSEGNPATAPYEVWAAVGREQGAGGAVFSVPLRVSSVAAAPPATNGDSGDCCSWIVADNKYVHIGWGDDRNGTNQIWYGRIPLANFTPGP
ncbi:MAG: exo-alpha-sialidase [Acidimicrobiaceae bacterium]|nr:exo-alpha-sialidase [Acidimicrobiaceae bacterium]